MEPYRDVIIGINFDKNDVGKAKTYLGVLSKKDPIWTERRREIILHVGKMQGKEELGICIGEMKKNKDGKWQWVWGIPLKDIHGSEILNLKEEVVEQK